MTKIEIHEKLLQFLIEQKVNFLPRQTNRDNKLEKKEWFLNGPNYNCLSFWTGFDGDRKVPNIALFFSLSEPFQLSLVLNSRSDRSSLPLLKGIAHQLGLTPVNRRNEWSKVLLNDPSNILQLQRAIKDFIDNEKNLIDVIVKAHDHPRIRPVSDEKFISLIANLNKYRNVNEKLNFLSPNKIGERKRLKRKGVRSKSEEEEIRNILAKRLVIKKQHSELQNKLFNQLTIRHPQNHLIMEENYIDLKFEDDQTIAIYEVKPYNSVIRCIKESLGQLMGYYFNLNNPNQKEIHLYIAGPKEQNALDKKYLNFLKNQIKTKLEYISIENELL